jgi:hypothetical protein
MKVPSLVIVIIILLIAIVINKQVTKNDSLRGFGSFDAEMRKALAHTRGMTKLTAQRSLPSLPKL